MNTRHDDMSITAHFKQYHVIHAIHQTKLITRQLLSTRENFPRYIVRNLSSSYNCYNNLTSILHLTENNNAVPRLGVYCTSIVKKTSKICIYKKLTREIQVSSG